MELKAISLDKAFDIMDGISFTLGFYELDDSDNNRNIILTKDLFQHFCEVNGIDMVFEK